MPYISMQERQKMADCFLCGDCQLAITLQQGFFECDKCAKKFHPQCKNIYGQHITRLASSPNWFCSDLCCNSLSINSDEENDLNVNSSLQTATSILEPSSSVVLAETMSTAKASMASCSTNVVKDIITSLATQLQEVLNTVNNLGKMLDEMQEAQVKLEGRVTKTECNVKELQDENTTLKEELKLCSQSKNEEKLFRLEIELDALRYNECKESLIISGIPNNTLQPKQIVDNFLTLLDMNSYTDRVKETTLVDVNRKNHVNATPLQFLKIVFCDQVAKMDILKKCKQRRKLFTNEVGFKVGDDHQLYVREQLTSYKAKLFREVLAYKKSNNYNFLWTKNNKILRKKDENSNVITINTSAD